jgi:N-ethylmaleimide reductase
VLFLNKVEGWRLTTDAVHATGGTIVLQIWHAGRVAHSGLNDGVQPVGPSPIAANGETHTLVGKEKYEVPRELTDDDCAEIVAAFGKAAANARRAGFDGVELHGIQRLLIDPHRTFCTLQAPMAI